MYLQFGHGMMSLSEELLSAWRSGGVILSPRDLDVDQLKRTATMAQTSGTEALLDPQCYAHDADREKLVTKEYWKEYRALATSALTSPANAGRVLEKLAKLAKDVGVARHILPGLMAPSVNEDWFALQEVMIAEAPKHFSDQPLLATVALSDVALQDDVQVEAVVERAAEWNVSGFYVVAETPGAYLVDSPVWMANLLILVSGLKLLNKPVIVGYCSHQMLALAATKADVIASGTWLNVRAFQNEKFYERDEDEVSRRAKGGWYYCPAALSEYKRAFLDAAHKSGVLGDMQPSPELKCGYAAPLFAGPRPTAVIGWGEPEAFRHYLCCLRSQFRLSRKPTFDATIGEHHRLLDDAAKLLNTLRSNGVFGQDREFTDYVDVNRSALALFVSARGARMRREW
ncbi:MAG: hypothetical protein WCE40_04570 [Polyangia bacterium]